MNGTNNSISLWLDRFVVACLYGVLLIPLVFQHQLMHPFVTAKTIFFQIIISFAFAGYLALAFFYKEYRPRVTPLFIAVCALFAAIVISGVFGVNPMRSMWSVPDRMTGIVLMGHLVLYFVMLSGMRVAFSWRRYLSVSVIASFFTALVPVIQMVFPAILFDRLGDRLSGTMGNPIFLAVYLFFHVFIAAWLAEQAHAERKRWWPYALIAGFDLVVIILTQTRGALIAGIASLVVLSLYAVCGAGNTRVRKAVYVGWACILIFVGVFWMTRTAPVWRGVPILSRIAQEGFRADNRFIVWKIGLTVFTEYPITGVGWDNFYAGFNAHYDPRLLRSGFTETFFDRPHNVFIQFLTETGVIGFTAYLFLLGFALYLVRKNKWLVAMLVAYMAQNFFVFDSVASYVIFFAILAWIDAQSSTRTVGSSARRGTASAEALVFILLLSIAGAGMYFFTYRLYAASRLEWKSVNYFVQGQMPEGVEYMDKALQASTPYHVYIAKDLYPNIALLYKQGLPLPDTRNLVARAVKGMTETAEAEPLNYGFWIGLADMMPAIVALDAHYIDQGLAALERANTISPRRQATHYVRAKLLNLKGDKAGSLKAMADAVALDPEVGDAHFFYGLLLLESGDKQGGVRELNRAAALGRNPKNISEATVAAGQLGDLGAYKESIEYFGKALLFEPDNAEVNMKLGLVYYFSGDRDVARRIIAKVMKTQDLKKSPQYELLVPILRDLGFLK